MTRPKRLIDLYSVGPATVRDLKAIGITGVDQLKRADSNRLYRSLCEITGATHDPCVIDVFRAAIEQAKDPNLDPVKRAWWYWTQERKKSKKRS